MVTVRTTQYYLHSFGPLQANLKKVVEAKRPEDDVYEYSFSTKVLFFEFIHNGKFKIKKNKIFQGNTVIGVYKFSEEEISNNTNNQRNKSAPKRGKTRNR